MLQAPPKRGLEGENFIPSSGSRRRPVFLNMTQTLTKLEEMSKNGAPLTARAGIHSALMALIKATGDRRTDGGADRRQGNLNFLGETAAIGCFLTSSGES